MEREGRSAKGRRVAVALCALLLAAGIAAAVYGFARGHEEAYHTTREIPWGILLAGYLSFVVASTGTYLVASIGFVFGGKALAPVARRGILVAVALLLSAFAVMACELEHPLRMVVYFFESPNPQAPVWWMGVFYPIYLALAICALCALGLRRRGAARVAGFLGVMAAVAADSNLGSVFGLLPGRAYWYGAATPVYSLVMALCAGGAALLLAEIVIGALRGEAAGEERAQARAALCRIEIAFLAALAVFEFWKVRTGLWGGAPGRAEILEELVRGRWMGPYWGLGIAPAMGVPILLLVLAGRRGRPVPAALAAASCLLGIFMMRVEFVALGQAIPAARLVGAVAEEPFLHYAPSLVEIGIVAGGLGLCGLVVLAGDALILPRRIAAPPPPEAA